ncbi:hypothetical protein IQ07DRAFT_503900 [Pyrenochaeta sp. DS3sAY3a]|nr:hypothetical protein IQ07DRAFT_503900 [Pyrenochaeta sp. DS3sAY3a]
MRADKAAHPEKYATRFDVRTSSGAQFTPTTSSSRYTTEERKPSRSYDDDRYYEDRSRSKYDTYDAFPKSGPSPRSSRSEKESSSRSTARAKEDRTRSERNKTRDREARSERKFNTVESESSSDEKARYEADYKRRSEDEARRLAKEAIRKADDRRSHEEPRYSDARSKMNSQAEEAMRYQHKTRAQVEAELNVRPSPTRTSSRDYYGESSRSARRDSRPEAVRRSSARPKDRPSSSGRDRDRGFPEIVDWGEHRSPPSFKHSSSSPAHIEVPRAMPQRSHTESSSREHRRADASPPPVFVRSSTMPSSSSRRKESTVPRPSGLRETMTPEHSPEHEFPTIPQPQRKVYHYPTPSGGVPLRSEDVAASSGNHRTVLREPERHRMRSPSPLSRPPMGANRPSENSAPQYASKPVAPTTTRSNSSRKLSPVRGTDERGRVRPSLYGEIGGSRGRQPSFSPGEVQYSRKFGPEDVRWAPRSSQNDREYASKPSLGRTATYVY